jgi:hypothetical protein
MAMGRRTLVPDAGEVVLDQLMVEGQGRLVMVLRPAGEGSVCPECRQASRRIHSDTAAGSTICHGKGFRCGSSFVFDGSFAIRKAVDTAYSLKVYRRLYSDMLGLLAG